jgi:hypothetical protein
MITISPKTLRDALKAVSPAMSRDETREHLRQIYIAQGGGAPLDIVATDGHRLHVYSLAASCSCTGDGSPCPINAPSCKDLAPFAVGIPACAVKQVAAACVAEIKRVGKYGTPSSATLTATEFKLGGTTIALGGPACGKFPPYDRVIPAHVPAGERCPALRIHGPYLADAALACAIVGTGESADVEFGGDTLAPCRMEGKGTDEGSGVACTVTCVIMPIRM